MSAPYTSTLAIPEGFAEVLRDFTREVLRDQPESIYSYGATYFARLSAGMKSSQPASASIDVASLKERLYEMFVAADENKTGYLSRKQTVHIVRNVGAELDFDDEQIRFIMSEADENSDGKIEFNEFLPLMLEVVEAIVVQREQQQADELHMAEASDYLLHGMDRAELEQLTRDMFRQADQNGSGFLTRHEFMAALKNADLGFTRREINALMHEVDENNDGVISYEEFVPVAFEMCVAVVSRAISHKDLPQGAAEIAQYLTELFASADVDETGRLNVYDIEQLLRQSDLGLSRVQIHVLLSHAVRDENDTTDYQQFAVDASTMMQSMINFTDAVMAQQRREYRSSDEFKNVRGMREADFTAALGQSLDARGAQNALSLSSIRDAIVEVVPDISGNEMNALMSLLRASEQTNTHAEQSLYDCGELQQHGFRVLQSHKEAQMFMR